MGFPKLTRASSFLLLFLVLYCFSPEIHRLGDHVRQTNPLSGHRRVEQAFAPTSKELACLYGLSPRPSSQHVLPDPEAVSVTGGAIPNIVHFIFLQRLPLGLVGQGDFDFVAYLSVRSAIVSLRPDRVLLHYGYTGQPSSQRANGTTEAQGDPLVDRNQWIRRLKGNVELVRHRRPLDGLLHHVEHIADTMRLEVLLAYGGIYMDIDAFALRPFADILSTPSPHDVILGNEGGNRAGLCNAIIAARRNSTFVQRWLQSYKGVDLNKEWNYHSVVLPKLLAAKHPHEVCKLPPDAFFWPTWTWRHVQWMHEPIDGAEARRWQRRIEQTGGGLFENQLAYHAWSQMARGRFLKRLTPQVVRDEDTRFNLLMRRFVEEDV